jgi:PAS domain S-box-containing protein
VTFDVLDSAEAIWVETDAEYAALYPELAGAKLREPRARAFFCVPLVAEGRTIGLLGAGYYAPRTFSSDERAFVETLAGHCAQALLRSARREREERAQQWFTTTLRSIGDAVIATDALGRVRLLNPLAERLTGWKEAEAQGRMLDEVFTISSEETGEAVESPVGKVIQEGNVVGLANHTVLRGRCGRGVPIEDSAAPIRGEDGHVLGVVLVFRDATREKRDRARSEFLAKAGETLVSSLDYESTLETVACLAVPALADWCVVDMLDTNTAALRRVALAHADPSKVRLARELHDHHPPSQPRGPAGVWQVVRTGRPLLLTEIPDALVEASAEDAEHLRVLRELRLCSAMVLPLRARGRSVGAMTFLHAESGRHYTEEDLSFAEDFARRAGLAIENAMAMQEMQEARTRERALRDEAELANRAKDEFLATVSHELRTPLSAILGWTVMLRRRQLGAETDRALAIVERNARAQTRLINDVLDLSRIISGKLVLSLGSTNVVEAVGAAVETVAPAAEAKGIEITCEMPGEATVAGDPGRLQQVVWNLLANAIKFTPKGGKVLVRVSREDSEVCIRVRDTGEGIRSDLVPLVFEPFRQADSSPSRRHGGLGLGLAIVKRLVDAHGGSVGAESDGLGKGATFTVRLPMRPAASALTTSPPRTGADARAQLEGLCLLVVDDEEDARTLVAEVLGQHGAEVHVAGSAEEALERFAAIRPDVVVSDIGMPGADGFSLIRRIRSLPQDRGGRTPAVALTAYTRTDDEKRAFAAGYQIHVPKPVEPEQLANVVAGRGPARGGAGPRREEAEAQVRR